ncbi:lasso peptide biosynthesis B2 protein [Paenibacillus polymyxa]|uniref:Lasso peptide biosynthesis B2 protein n=1 Tax=Paenibacillus polymyxa TaxID=1406 RepID=A0A8I1LW55_PAEPO|nr:MULTISPECIES: lasso peptide biosynthesis B2 protein [Paenibacillus]KAF6569857.1 lasso peptide biosynthesis B2 protein [Paenibacillus sp. EKM206P]KAF6585423.1 lasso peptide biosynthesis B2 protein [Paenibacillus sp. EKM205P]MBM0635678.1 lasso peptide biosynthesis B2 protein [Paenibacillus polymyxa]
MDIPLFPEKPEQVSNQAKWNARLALLLSVPLNWLPPSMIEKIFSRLTRRYPAASNEQIQVIRDAVCTVSMRCRSQGGCLRRSLAVVVATWLKRRSVSWCTGYALEPFRAHAWVELNSIPVGEPDEISLYTKVISVSIYDDEKLQK